MEPLSSLHHPTTGMKLEAVDSSEALDIVCRSVRAYLSSLLHCLVEGPHEEFTLISVCVCVCVCVCVLSLIHI